MKKKFMWTDKNIWKGIVIFGRIHSIILSRSSDNLGLFLNVSYDSLQFNSLAAALPSSPERKYFSSDILLLACVAFLLWFMHDSYALARTVLIHLFSKVFYVEVKLLKNKIKKSPFHSVDFSQTWDFCRNGRLNIFLGDYGFVHVACSLEYRG